MNISEKKQPIKTRPKCPIVPQGFNDYPLRTFRYTNASKLVLTSSRELSINSIIQRNRQPHRKPHIGNRWSMNIKIFISSI